MGEPEPKTLAEAAIKAIVNCFEETFLELESENQKLKELGKWISVKDRLPDDIRKKWVYADGFVREAFWQPITRHAWVSCLNFSVDVKNVTHWMDNNTPAPPNESEGK